MTQKHNELHKLGFYFLSVLQAEESDLFMPRGRWAESKRKGAKDDGRNLTEKQEPIVTPVKKHWI